MKPRHLAVILIIIIFLVGCASTPDSFQQHETGEFGVFQPNGADRIGAEGTYIVQRTAVPTITIIVPTIALPTLALPTPTALPPLPTALPPLPPMVEAPSPFGPDARTGLSYCVSNYALALNQSRAANDQIPHIYLPGTCPLAYDESYCNLQARWEALPTNTGGCTNQQRRYSPP